MAIYALSAGAACVGACASREQQLAPRASAAPGTARWTAVMSPGVAEASAGAWEGSRNDLALGVSVEHALTAADQWPERAQPSLYHARRLSLPRSADQILYFPRVEGHHGRYGHGHHHHYGHVAPGRWWWGGE